MSATASVTHWLGYILSAIGGAVSFWAFVALTKYHLGGAADEARGVGRDA